MVKMDIDDKVFHYLLLFGGMLIASTIHHVFDALGWNITKYILRLFGVKPPKEDPDKN
jgi:hypothetical protein